MSALAWLVPALPLGAGSLLAVSGRRRFVAGTALAVAVATLGLACAAAAVQPGASAPLFAGIRAALAVQGLSAVLAPTVAAATLAVLAFAAAELGREEARARFFGLMLVFAGAMLVTVTAATLPLLLMGWEAMGAASWALIGFWWRERRRVEAANTAFVVTRAADLGLYLAAGAALAGGVSTLALDGLAGARAPWLGVVAAGVVLAALGKSAQLPFSFWLSRAMEGPSPVSALLHSATMVAAGAYLLLRLQPLLEAAAPAAAAVAWTGAVTALALGAVAVAQRDLKQLLAASTSAQIGFMVLAAGAGATAGGTLQLLAHAATKSLLFLAAGAFLAALGTKQLPALRGAARRHPLVGGAFTAGCFVLAGLPPGSIWVAKDELLAAVSERDPALYAVGLAAGLVSAVYSAKAVWYVWQPLPPDAETGYDEERPGTRSTGAGLVAPLLALAAFAAGLGVLALPRVAEPFRTLLGAGSEPEPAAWALALSAAVALAGAAFGWTAAERPLPAPLRGWLGLEAAAHAALVRPTLALARALARFDDEVLDRAVTGTARAGLVAARAADRRGEAALDGAVAAAAAGARRLGRLARRPQTGQLHHYYAQAAAALALLALAFALVR